MAITDLPLFSMLRTRMHWHQERQRVLAENVSNANTPEFRPRDLAPPQFDRRPAPAVGRAWRAPRARTSPRASATGSTQFQAAGSAATTCGPPATRSISRTR